MCSVDRVITLGGGGGGRKPETGIIYVHSVNSYVWSLIMRHLRHPPKSFRFLFCQLMRLTLSCLLLSTSTHNASKKSRPMTPTTLWKVWVSSGVTLFLSSNCSRQTSRTSHIYMYDIWTLYGLIPGDSILCVLFWMARGSKGHFESPGICIYIYGGLAVERKVLLADKITVNKSTDDGTAER